MDAERLRKYCLSKKGATSDYPFGPGTQVFRVMGKMFALMGDGDAKTVNLKCDPLRAKMLRETYQAVKPGYHQDKRHWNTVELGDKNLPDDEILDMVDHSYALVVKGLTRKEREALEGMPQ